MSTSMVRPASGLVPALSFSDVLDLMWARMPLRRSGTYNEADPTAYENREGWVSFQYSPFTRRGHPGEFRVTADDCTWGVEVTVRRPDGSERLRFYMDRPHGGIDQRVHVRRGTGPDVTRFLRDAVLHGEWSVKRPEPAEPDYPMVHR